MPPISEVVNVTVTRQTTAVTQAGFGTMLVVGESGTLPEVDVAVITFSADMVASNKLTFYLNGAEVTGEEFTFDTSWATTIGNMATAIALLDGVASCADDDTARTLTITGDADTIISVTGGVVTGGASQPTVSVTTTSAARIRFYTSLTAVADDFATTDPEYLAAQACFAQSPSPTQVAIGAKWSGDSTWAEALNAIVAENNSWYGLVITSRTQADVEAVALWAETVSKYFMTASADTGILSAASTTDVAYVLEAAAYDRSKAFYHPAADGTTTDPFPEAALFGVILPTTPGSVTWANKTLSGVAVTVLTTTQSTAAQDKNCETYETIGGVNITRQGKSASGEFSDVMRFSDWVEARMEEQIFGKLVNLPKVPFTDAGIAVVTAEMRSVLNQGIANGGIDPVQGYVISAPKAADISSNDKALRNLTGITFTAYLAGAIHKTTINGVVTL